MLGVETRLWNRPARSPVEITEIRSIVEQDFLVHRRSVLVRYKVSFET